MKKRYLNLITDHIDSDESYLTEYDNMTPEERDEVFRDLMDFFYKGGSIVDFYD